MDQADRLLKRVAPIEMKPDEFRRLGYHMVDRIADWLAALPEHPITPGESPNFIRRLIGSGAIPEQGCDPRLLLDEAADLLFNHSLFNGHPRFLGFITSSAAPIGALGDLLAAAVNPNVGGWALSPIASEIETQTVRWIAQMIGYSSDAGGVLVSGGNMANFIGFIAARRAKANWDVRVTGLRGGDARLCVYVSNETHTPGFKRRLTFAAWEQTRSVGLPLTNSSASTPLPSAQQFSRISILEIDLLWLWERPVRSAPAR